MHANHSHPDDLSGLERQLAGWQPAADGLDPNAMLFAAGRAAARPRSRLLWPTAAGAFAVLALALAAWALTERAERLALADALRQPPPAPSPPAEAPAALPLSDPPSDSGGEAPRGPLALRNLVLERGIDAWRDEALARAGPPGPPPPEPTTLQAWRRDQLAEP